MPDIKNILTEEIRRLAKKELRIALQPMVAAFAEQKKRIAELEKIVKKLTEESNLSAPKESRTTVVTEDTLPEKSIRLTPERIRKIRIRLKLSQADMAKLIGVTPVSVCQWELGKSHPRLAQKKQLATIRDMGKRELAKLMAERLAATAPEPETITEKQDNMSPAVEF